MINKDQLIAVLTIIGMDIAIIVYTIISDIVNYI